MSGSPWLVDFAIRLVNPVLNLPERFFGKFRLQKNCNQCCSAKKFLGYLKALAQMASRKTSFLCTLTKFLHMKYEAIGGCCFQSVWRYSSILRNIIFLINNNYWSNTILKFHFLDSAFESSRDKIWKRAAGVICFQLAIKKLKLIDIKSVQHWQLLHWLVVFN